MELLSLGGSDGENAIGVLGPSSVCMSWREEFIAGARLNGHYVAQSVSHSRVNGFLIIIGGTFAQICQVALIDSVVGVAGRGLRDLIKLVLLTLAVDEVKLAVGEAECTDPQVQLCRVTGLHRVLDRHHHLLQDVNDGLLGSVRHFRDLKEGYTLQGLGLEKFLDLH